MTSLVAAQLFLAAGGTGNNQPGGQGQEFGSAGPVALIVLIVLFIGVGFLIRSMSKHLKKVPATFDPEEQAEATDPAEEQTGQAEDTAPAPAAEKEKQDH
jgi:Na+-transporting methylmalonyl-CoA/oxaloacetate decarboxylase gamma subunit